MQGRVCSAKTFVELCSELMEKSGQHNKHMLRACYVRSATLITVRVTLMGHTPVFQEVPTCEEAAGQFWTL